MNLLIIIHKMQCRPIV